MLHKRCVTTEFQCNSKEIPSDHIQQNDRQKCQKQKKKNARERNCLLQIFVVFAVCNVKRKTEEIMKKIQHKKGHKMQEFENFCQEFLKKTKLKIK